MLSPLAWIVNELSVVMLGMNKRVRRRKGYVFVGYLSTFHVKPFLVIHLMGKPVAVFKRANGTLFAWEMACTNDGADMTKGEIENGVVTCPRHGHRFDLDTGECLNRSFPSLKQHAVRLNDDGVYVSLTPKPREPDSGRRQSWEDTSERRLTDLV